MEERDHAPNALRDRHGVTQARVGERRVVDAHENAPNGVSRAGHGARLARRSFVAELRVLDGSIHCLVSKLRAGHRRDAAASGLRRRAPSADWLTRATTLSTMHAAVFGRGLGSACEASGSGPRLDTHSRGRLSSDLAQRKIRSTSARFACGDPGQGGQLRLSSRAWRLAVPYHDAPVSGRRRAGAPALAFRYEDLLGRLLGGPQLVARANAVRAGRRTID